MNGCIICKKNVPCRMVQALTVVVYPPPSFVQEHYACVRQNHPRMKKQQTVNRNRLTGYEWCIQNEKQTKLPKNRTIPSFHMAPRKKRGEENIPYRTIPCHSIPWNNMSCHTIPYCAPHRKRRTATFAPHYARLTRPICRGATYINPRNPPARPVPASPLSLHRFPTSTGLKLSASTTPPPAVGEKKKKREKNCCFYEQKQNAKIMRQKKNEGNKRNYLIIT